MSDDSAVVPPLPGAPYDIEFFFDPRCPFAWQASVWVRRVVEIRGVKVGWRFISLRFINEGKELPAHTVEAQERGLRYHRICAAARERFGNDAVGELYRAWGGHHWYDESPGAPTADPDPVEVLRSLDLPEDLADAADDPSWDAVIRQETEEAFRRTGDGVGTPIITYDPPHGNSLFGPVLSEVPDDEQSVAFYDALRTFADFKGFSELKRTQRQPLDLPLLAG